MRNDLVSVVIPAYNAGDFIAESVTSVFAQSYRPLEILVVNDGSSDGTIDIVKKLQSPQDVRLELIDIGKNKGAANALNVGFSTAKGSFISWLSADDSFLDPDKISRQSLLMQKRNADWSYYRHFMEGPSPAQATLARPTFLTQARFLLEPIVRRDSKLQFATLLFRNPINGSSVMIRRQCIEENGQFDPYLNNVDGDGDLWLRYTSLGLKCLAISGAPIFYRLHESQTSKSTEKMTVGQQLSRMRVLKVLARAGHLKTILRRFTLFFPLVTRGRDHLLLPKSAEFLCTYILEELPKTNVMLRSHAKRILLEVRKQMSGSTLDSATFDRQLESISQTPSIKRYEEILNRGRT